MSARGRPAGGPTRDARSVAEGLTWLVGCTLGGGAAGALTSTPAAPLLAPLALAAAQGLVLSGRRISVRAAWVLATAGGLLFGYALAVVLGLLFLVREPSGAPTLGSHLALSLVFGVPGALVGVLQGAAVAQAARVSASWVLASAGGVSMASLPWIGLGLAPGLLSTRPVALTEGAQAGLAAGLLYGAITLPARGSLMRLSPSGT